MGNIKGESESMKKIALITISHSPEYRETYHPHYRIVERGIFERELKPLIERKYLQNKNNNMDDKIPSGALSIKSGRLLMPCWENVSRT